MFQPNLDAWISLVSGDITTYPILYYIDTNENHLFSGFVWLVKCPNQSTKNILDAYVCKWYNSDVARMTKIK